MPENEPVSVQPFSADATATSRERSTPTAGTADTYWLVTTRPDCRPHAVPVLAVWVDDVLHFVAGPSTRKARTSRATRTASSPPLRPIARSGGPPPYEVYEVTTAFGFGTDESLDSTRWRFSRARAPMAVSPVAVINVSGSSQRGIPANRSKSVTRSRAWSQSTARALRATGAVARVESSTRAPGFASLSTSRPASRRTRRSRRARGHIRRNRLPARSSSQDRDRRDAWRSPSCGSNAAEQASEDLRQRS